MLTGRTKKEICIFSSNIQFDNYFLFQVLPSRNANSVFDIQLDLLAELWVTVSLDGKGWRFVNVCKLVGDDQLMWASMV